MLNNSPPHNLKAEMALLGSLMYDNILIDELKVKETDFYRTRNQVLYECMVNLYKQNIKIDAITIQESMKDDFDNIGSYEYMNDCMTEGIITSNFKHWENIIIEKSILRKQIIIAQEILDTAYSGTDASNLFKKIDDLDDYDDGDIIMIKDFIHETMDDMEKYQNREMNEGIMTKIKGLDYYVNGLMDGDLIYLGARPSMGKSALAMQIMLNIAESGKHVVFFSLEMQNKKLAKRMLVNQSKVHLKRIKDRQLDENENKRLLNAAAKLHNQNIAMSDKGNQSVSEIIRKAKRHKKKFGLDILIIDHFHLLKSDGKFNSLYERRSHDSQALKDGAKELGCPIICLCQLNRALEARPISDRLPLLSDLKETGSLEQDGDVIIFLNREDYWHKNESDYILNNEATVSVAKNRDGEIGIFNTNWHAGTQRFEDK